MCTVFWLENLKGGDFLEDLDVDVKIILEFILRKQDGKVWIRRIWFSIETNGGFL